MGFLIKTFIETSVCYSKTELNDDCVRDAILIFSQINEHKGISGVSSSMKEKTFGFFLSVLLETNIFHLDHILEELVGPSLPGI